MDMFFGWDHFLHKFAAFLHHFYNRFFYLVIAFTMGYFSLGVGGGPERPEYCVGNVQNCSPQIL